MPEGFEFSTSLGTHASSANPPAGMLTVSGYSSNTSRRSLMPLTQGAGHILALVLEGAHDHGEALGSALAAGTVIARGQLQVTNAYGGRLVPDRQRTVAGAGREGTGRRLAHAGGSLDIDASQLCCSGAQ